MKQNFPECVRRVFLSEGGYTNNPSDPGGPTNWGITITDARLYWKSNATASDVRDMPKSVAYSIYKSKYWDKLRCDDLPSGLDYTVCDFGINSGISRSAKYLQAALSIPQDGVIGPKTLAALNTHDTASLIRQVNDKRLAFLKGLSTWRVFGKGWGTRVASVRAFSLQLASQGPQAPISEPPKQATAVLNNPPATSGPVTSIWSEIGDVLASTVHKIEPK